MIALGILVAEGRSDVTDPSTTDQASNWPFAVLWLGGVIIAAVILTRAMRLANAPSNAWRLNAAASLALFLALNVLGSVGGALSGKVFGLPSSSESLQDKLVMAAGGLVAQAIVLIFFLRTWKWSALFAQSNVIGASPVPSAAPWSNLQSLLFGCAVFVIAWFPMQSVASVVELLQVRWGGDAPPVEGHLTFELLRNSQDTLLKGAMVVNVILFAPIIEEFAFRGALQMSMRRAGLPRWWTIIATSSVFAAVHIPVLVPEAMASGLTTLFLLALGLGWLMERTGRIIAPIMAHALFNSLNLAMFWWS